MLIFDVFTFFFQEKQGKIAEYYKKQEKLLEGFNEMETMHEVGGLPDALTEVSFGVWHDSAFRF